MPEAGQAADVVRLFETVRTEYGTLNVLGYLLAVREALKLLGPTGRIINISSILSTDPYLARVFTRRRGRGRHVDPRTGQGAWRALHPGQLDPAGTQEHSGD